MSQLTQQAFKQRVIVTKKWSGFFSCWHNKNKPTIRIKKKKQSDKACAYIPRIGNIINFTNIYKRMTVIGVIMTESYTFNLIVKIDWSQ